MNAAGYSVKILDRSEDVRYAIMTNMDGKIAIGLVAEDIVDNGIDDAVVELMGDEPYIRIGEDNRYRLPNGVAFAFEDDDSVDIFSINEDYRIVSGWHASITRLPARSQQTVVTRAYL